MRLAYCLMATLMLLIAWPFMLLLAAVKIGDRVERGQVIGEIHAHDDMTLQQAQRDVPAALKLTDEPVARRPLFYATINGQG